MVQSLPSITVQAMDTVMIRILRSAIKAVGSIGVDFRQYLQDYSSGPPERHNNQEQYNDSAYSRYQIKNYAYNTAGRSEDDSESSV